MDRRGFLGTLMAGLGALALKPRGRHTYNLEMDAINLQFDMLVAN